MTEGYQKQTVHQAAQLLSYFASISDDEAHRPLYAQSGTLYEELQKEPPSLEALRAASEIVATTTAILFRQPT